MRNERRLWIVGAGMALMMLAGPVGVAAAQGSAGGEDPAAASRYTYPDSNGEWAGERAPQDTWNRWGRQGRDQLPRVVFTAPPFEQYSYNYWKPGGVWENEDPRLFLMPIRTAVIFDDDLVGGDFEWRIIGNSILSGGFTMWGLAQTNGYGDFYRGTWDLSFQHWFNPFSSIEIGPSVGFERDVLLVSPANRDFGFIFGLDLRSRIGPVELGAFWRMRVDQRHRLGFGDVRHSVRLTFDAELIRWDVLGLVTGGWAHFVSGGKPTIGLRLGLRFWIAPSRERPEYAGRYAE